ncbi:hypothetical protein [Devosia sp.]|uniref:hypothetical protein n=1 Tax=Devosia sp. TaxID=1871048 RepID=UPI00273737F8|nr:hypothetical protein [Devosia sp.]MDP2779667.1 hypothetical protein [Devosia sp.]
MVADKPKADPKHPAPARDGEPDERPTPEELDAELDRQLADSFPASDPPKVTRPGHQD